MIVGTTNNHASLFMSVKKAAADFIKPGAKINEGLLNRIEMAWRPYDPCMSCATHALPSQLPLEVTIYDAQGDELKCSARL
jgi:F420-non-reducing hydrogenase large subunit